ncbi:MAG: hypothetical protein ACI8WB_002824 [Phenylobacterium sp.]|jgi:hypothetical protein
MGKIPSANLTASGDGAGKRDFTGLRAKARALVVVGFCLFLNSGSLCWDRESVYRHYLAQPDSILLYQAVKLRHPQALLQYYAAHPQWSLTVKNQWLSQPALTHHAQAHYLKGFNRYHSGQLADARFWLKSAWGKGSVAGALLYSQLLTQLGALPEAKKVLSSAVLRGDPNAQLRLAQVMLDNNDISEARQWLTQQSSKDAQGLLQEVDKLLNLPLSVVEQRQGECSLNLQLVVAGYHELRYAAEVIRQWSADVAMQGLAVCFKPPVLFEPARFACRDNAGDKLQCNLTLLADQLAIADNVTPVLIYGQSGVANYSNGMVYLNRHKGYGVFKHELFHHFGFIDEYALPPVIAARVCQTEQVGFAGENLMVVPAGQAIELSQAQLYWPGENITLTPVSTCQGLASRAYKPVAQLTLMAFMDQAMPQLYIRRAKFKLDQEAFDLANYQYGYALAYDDKGQRQDYLHWLRLSAQQGYRVAERLLQQETETDNRLGSINE